jgi:hypothetical protein
MNAQALEHEGTMLEVYSKMKPDTFHVTVANDVGSILQNEAWHLSRHSCKPSWPPITRRSRGLWAPAVAPSPWWSSASSRTGLAPDADPADPADPTDPADADTATPATPPDGSAAAAPDGEGPLPAPSPWCKGGGGKAGKAGGGGRKAGKPQGWCRLKSCAWTWIGVTPIKVVCLNLNRWIKKLDPKGYINVRTRFSNVCTFHEMYVALCTLNMSYTTHNTQVCTLYVHVYMIQNAYIIV